MLSAYRVLVLAFAALSRSGALAPEPPFKAISQMSGADSAIEIPRVTVVTDQDGWARLWSEHHSTFHIGVPANAQDADADRPKVSFEKDAILCLFGGQSKNVGGFQVEDSGNDAHDAFVKVEPLLLAPSGTTILQNPFIFVIVPKTRRKIVVQLDQVPLGGEGARTLAIIEPTKK